MVANSSGGILDDSDFYPYGGERVVTSSSGNYFKFSGKERDTESGLDNFGARYYGSNMGRFMTPDPKPASARLVDPQSWNRYAYTRNNPLKYVDRDGKDYQIAYNSKTNTATVTNQHRSNRPRGDEAARGGLAERHTGENRRTTQHQFWNDIGYQSQCHNRIPKSVPAAARNEMNVDPAAKKTEVTPTTDGKHANQGTGTPEDLSDPNVRTHETLHYGGLSDQYDPASNNPLPGQEGSLMGDPEP